MPKSKPRVILDRRARDNLKKIPGNTRQAIIAELNALVCSPRPAKSQRLVIEKESREVRRLRLGKWRIIYLVQDEQPVILAIRRRPPYDYQDLEELLKDL